MKVTLKSFSDNLNYNCEKLAENVSNLTQENSCLKAEIKKAFNLNLDLETKMKIAGNENLDLNDNKNNMNETHERLLKSISQLNDEIQSLKNEKLNHSLLQSQQVKGIFIFKLNILFEPINFFFIRVLQLRVCVRKIIVLKKYLRGLTSTI